MESFENIREILTRKEYAQFKIDRSRVDNIDYAYNFPVLGEKILKGKI